MKIQKHLTLGELICELKQYDPDMPIEFDFCGFIPDGIESYRRYYKQLAIGYKDRSGQGCTVSYLLELCQSANGKTFTGYKGGEYVMSNHTFVWVANRGHCDGTAIVGIQDEGYKLYIQTAHID